jgi:hypothetical protein
MDITLEYRQKLKDMGVQSFKIIGREMKDDEFYDELIRFTKK